MMVKDEKVNSQPAFGSFLQGYLDGLKNQEASPLPDLDGLARSYARAVAPQRAKEALAKAEALEKKVALLEAAERRKRRGKSAKEADLKDVIRQAKSILPKEASQTRIATLADLLLEKKKWSLRKACPKGWRKVPRLLVEALNDPKLAPLVKPYISKA